MLMKRVPVILQFSDTECGVAALAMIFGYYGLKLTLEKLRDHCGATRDGCSANILLQVATHFGFQANAYSIDLAEATKLKAPVIAHWKFSHYIVLIKIKKNIAYIVDPAFGKLTMSLEEFDRG